MMIEDENIYKDFSSTEGSEGNKKDWGRRCIRNTTV